MTIPNNPSRRTSLSMAATSLIAGTVGAALSACGSADANSSSTFPSKKETIILLHGSWHGSWCWNKVRPLLLAAGYDALAPTFTGLAERSAYGSLAVGLRSHANEIAKLLDANDLSNVVLVGHSYAGLVMSEVAETMSSRIKHLVYVDAFAVNHNESAFDFFPPGLSDILTNLATTGNGWGFPAVPADDLVGADGAAADKALLTRLLSPMPVNTHAQKQNTPTNQWAKMPKTYISCKRFPNIDNVKARVKSQSGWNYQEIDTYHDCMLTTPQTLANLLIAAAS
jgi:pimeloyl-ACP methyl ester carboxylesterase